MRRGKFSKVALATALVGGLAANLSSAQAEERNSSPPEATSLERERASDGGMIIYVDPSTGQIVPTPVGPPIIFSPKTRDALSTSDRGLSITRSRVPGGGILLRLHGRFQHALFGTVDDQGRLQVHDLQEPREPDIAK